nr:uncharacterized protein LOC112291626 isoform X3 [Physcomitrium patens]|eukprot:XP_024395080.1 uncharacterized protein LOC112291626 isoform X3 [Physcomitrella patens]
MRLLRKSNSGICTTQEPANTQLCGYSMIWSSAAADLHPQKQARGCDEGVQPLILQQVCPVQTRSKKLTNWILFLGPLQNQVRIPVHSAPWISAFIQLDRSPNVALACLQETSLDVNNPMCALHVGKSSSESCNIPTYRLLRSWADRDMINTHPSHPTNHAVINLEASTLVLNCTWRLIQALQDDHVDERERKRIIAKIAHACKDWGAFQLVNHGIQQVVIERARAQAGKVFELPDETRLKAKRPPGSLCGYGNGAIVADAFNSEIASEAITFGYPHSEADVIASKFWPKGNSDFGAVSKL